jgi:hypothetical protein
LHPIVGVHVYSAHGVLFLFVSALSYVSFSLTGFDGERLLGICFVKDTKMYNRQATLPEAR